MDSGKLSKAELDEGFILHLGEKRPETLPHTQGALVILRSGERALFPPGISDSIGQDHYWDKMFDYESEDDDEGEPSQSDIVAYKPLPVSACDELARAAFDILRYVRISLSEGEWGSGHPVAETLHRSGAAKARARITKAIATYARNWPDDPSLRSLRCLGQWGGDLT